MDHLQKAIGQIWSWLGIQNESLQGLLTLITIASMIVGPFLLLWRKGDKNVVIPESGMIIMTLDEYEERQRYLRQKIIAELQNAPNADRDRLQKELDEITQRLQDSETAYAKEKERLLALQTDLKALRNQIPSQQFADAESALAKGDTTLADQIFAKIETDGTEHAARAAFARGTIAEGDVNWTAAAAHYKRAADLAPTFDRLAKAVHYTHLTADYDQALIYGQQMLDWANKEGAEDKISHALNDHAQTLQALGRLEEAEPLMRKAMQIDKTALGEDHPSYARSLSNLAMLLQDLGRLEEAEPLMRKAMQIDKTALGEDHPSYARSLSNLATLLQDLARLEEAEPLAQKAVNVITAALPAGHPHIAVMQGNLDHIRAQMAGDQ